MKKAWPIWPETICLKYSRGCMQPIAMVLWKTLITAIYLSNFALTKWVAKLFKSGLKAGVENIYEVQAPKTQFIKTQFVHNSCRYCTLCQVLSSAHLYLQDGPCFTIYSNSHWIHKRKVINIFLQKQSVLFVIVWFESLIGKVKRNTWN